MSERRPLVTTPKEFTKRTASSDRKFLVVSLGGTIIQYPNPEDPEHKLIPHPEPLQLFKDHTTIEQMADINFRLIANVDSTNMKSKYWLDTANVIAQEQDFYDGILVTHGTDTMAHTAAALRFLLGRNLRIPIVLTGSQLPLTAGDSSDARSNLGDSIRTLAAARSAEVNEVMIVFGRKILRGNRANKESELKFDAFKSPAFPDLASLDAGPVSFDNSYHASRVVLPTGYPDSLFQIEVTGGFSQTPFGIEMNPDFEMTDELIDLFKRKVYTSAIMKSFGAGNIPDNIIPAIKVLSDIGIPVLIGASHPGAGMNSEYAVGDAPIKAGAVQTGNMLSHTAIVKLRMLQHKGLSLEEIKQQMPKPYYGEVG